MTDIRIRDGALQCATRTYRHHDGRAFTLIGVAHIARPAFWHHVTERIAEAEDQGHEIHYEMVTDPDHQLTNNGLPELFKGFANAFKLTAQYDGLTLNPDWRNTDMTVTQIMEASTDPALTRAWLDRPVDADLDVADNIKPILMWIIVRVVRSKWIARLITPGSVYKAVNDRRSDYATNLMLKRNTSITAIWGAAHLKRMGRNLQRAGFQSIGIAWASAIGGGA